MRFRAKSAVSMFIPMILVSQIATVSALPPEPLVSRYAQTQKAVTLDLGARYFNELELQEVEDFDGFSTDLELVVPLSERFQLWFLLPFYTDGDGTQIEDGRSIDIEGYGGTWDFPSIAVEYQFLDESEGWRPNMAVTLGMGYVLDDLEVRADGERVDQYNHRGTKYILGLKMDKAVLEDSLVVVGNLDLQYYPDSDDLNPGGDDEFTAINVSAGFILNDINPSWFPALELISRTTIGADNDTYSEFSVMPQVLFSGGQSWDFKFGAPFGLSGGSESYGARVEVSYQF